MSRTRHILAIVAVSTALCADQAATAAPISPPQVVQFTTTLARRLSQNLQRSAQTILGASSLPPRQQPTSPAPRRQPSSVIPPSHQPLSAFQFRLPPPALI